MMKCAQIFFLVSNVFYLQTSLASECGWFSKVQGEVSVLRLQTLDTESVRHAQPAKIGMRLLCKDIVVTGNAGQAVVSIRSGKIAFGPYSRVAMAQYRQVESKESDVEMVDLIYGKIRSLIKTKTPAKAHEVGFKVRTRAAVVGVRGTDFFVEYEPNAGVARQATIEGLVEVAFNDAQKPQLVPAGNQIVIEETPTRPATPKISPISDAMKDQIRLASSAAKDVQEFLHPKAVEVLGPVEKWNEKQKDKFDKLKNEF